MATDADSATEAPERPSRWRSARIARWITWAARVVGVLTVLSALAPLLRRRLQPGTWFGLPPEVGLAGTVVVVTGGIGLVLLATGLRRRKRRAWQLAVLLTVLTMVSHLAGRHPIAPIIVALVLLVGLVATRREFTAQPDPVGRFAAVDRKSTRLNSSHSGESRMPSSA